MEPIQKILEKIANVTGAQEVFETQNIFPLAFHK